MREPQRYISTKCCAGRATGGGGRIVATLRLCAKPAATESINKPKMPKTHAKTSDAGAADAKGAVAGKQLVRFNMGKRKQRESKESECSVSQKMRCLVGFESALLKMHGCCDFAQHDRKELVILRQAMQQFPAVLVCRVAQEHPLPHGTVAIP